MRGHRLRLVIGLCCGIAVARSGAADAPRGPQQPDSGPGGSDYIHANYERSRFGRAGEQYWLFTPTEPRPRRAPVVVFLHGWMTAEPLFYEAWIVHLVRRGAIVIFPRYQSGPRTPAAEFTALAARAVKQGLVRLRTSGPVKPDMTKLAFLGHCTGAVVAANLAASCASLDIPRPAAVMCVEPGRSLYTQTVFEVPRADYSSIAAGTLLLCLTGDEDHLADPAMATHIIRETKLVPKKAKSLVIACSDDHGDPALVADHTFPTGQLGSGYQLSALDFNACWKLFDGLTDAAFFGTNEQYALGNTPEQRYMGKWSDGTPVRELQVRDQ